MEAIKVMLESNNNTLFVIEGFNKKEVTDYILHKGILEHFKYLNGHSHIKIINFRNDFIVSVSGNEYRLTWSWVKSYKINPTY